MFLFHNGCVAVLLLVLGQSIVLASFKDGMNETEAIAVIMVEFLQKSWIDGVDSFIHLTKSPCATELAAFIEAVKSREMWALQMVDASSKIPSGILRGNTRVLGIYDECIRASGQYNDTKVRGKYCTISISTGSKISNMFDGSVANSFTSSVCIPSSCSEIQINNFTNVILQTRLATSNFGKMTSMVSCVPIESKDYTIGEILTITFFLMIGGFMVFCTICDFVKRIIPNYKFIGINELSKFSLYTNGIALLSTKQNPETMPAIQGIRFLSMCWIILGHRYFTTLLRPMINSVDIQDWYKSWASVYIQAAPFAVDTFFVISGFLTTYIFLKSKQAGMKSNLLMIYLHRYLRLTPCLAVVTLFVTFLLHRITSEVSQKILQTLIIKPCEKNWWVNLLYLQNFVNKAEMCLAHSWYLAIDMQLFSISPIILYPLHRWPKYGIGILYLFLVTSVLTPAIILVVNGYTNALVRLDINNKRVTVGFLNYYIPTYNRACAYFVGILLGYDIAIKKRQLSQTIVTINWLVASIFMFFCGWAIHYIYNPYSDSDFLFELVFSLLSRLFWSIGIAWIIYACTQGYGGILNTFLSLPLFQPLSRLSYCIYLVHLIIQVLKNFRAQTPATFMDFELFNEFWSDLVLSIAVAFVFSLFFESPVKVLEKILRKRFNDRNESNLILETKKDVEMEIPNKVITEKN